MHLTCEGIRFHTDIKVDKQRQILIKSTKTSCYSGRLEYKFNCTLINSF